MYINLKPCVLAVALPCLVFYQNIPLADTLISDVKVTGLFNDFNDLWEMGNPYFDLYFQLPDGKSSDLCPKGVHPNNGNLWRIATSNESAVNKAFVLLQAAMLADMSVTVTGTATQELDSSSVPTGWCYNEQIEYVIVSKDQN